MLINDFEIGTRALMTVLFPFMIMRTNESFLHAMSA